MSTRARLSFALDLLTAEHGFLFERFANAFLATEFSNLRPVGGVHDAGRDAFIYSGTSEEDVFFQHSVTESWAPKIRGTVRVLRDNGYKVRELIYCTPAEILRQTDELRVELRRAGVALDVRDKGFFVAFAETDASRRSAAADLASQIVDPLLAASGLSDLSEASRKLDAVFSQVAAATDADTRQLMDRVLSFPKDRRLVFFSTLVLGISPSFVAQLKLDEYDRLARHILGITFSLVDLVISVCQRLITQHVDAFRLAAPNCHSALPSVVERLLMRSMRTQMALIHFPTLAPDHITDYQVMPIEKRIQCHIDEVYLDCSKSPESMKSVALLSGAKSLREFVRQVGANAQAFTPQIQEAYREWMGLLPTQIMCIADSLSQFENRAVFMRNVETVNLLTKLRGSSKLPE